jgi:hypothetical protein
VTSRCHPSQHQDGRTRPEEHTAPISYPLPTLTLLSCIVRLWRDQNVRTVLPTGCSCTLHSWWALNGLTASLPLSLTHKHYSERCTPQELDVLIIFVTASHVTDSQLPE